MTWADTGADTGADLGRFRGRTRQPGLLEQASSTDPLVQVV